ncbi:MAG: hypothetical protein ACLFQH_00700 [Halothiobacillaceae bacterium]
MRRLVHALLPVALLCLLTACSAEPPDHPYLPWEIERTEEGHVSVFGITLGQTSLVEIRRLLDKRAEMAVFESPEGERALEAYFGKLMIGPLEARLVAVAEVEQARIDEWLASATQPDPQPSGAWRFELSFDAIEQAQHLPVRSISYVPTARYDRELVARRFGEPAEKRTDARKTEFWLYPDRGTLVSFDRDGRNLFQYIDPRQFDRLLATLED